LGGGRGGASETAVEGLTMLLDETALEWLGEGGAGAAYCSLESEKVRSAVKITSSSPFRSSMSNLKYRGEQESLFCPDDYPFKRTYLFKL